MSSRQLLAKRTLDNPKDIPKRIRQHRRAGKLKSVDIGTVTTREVTGGRTSREIAEQLRIDELGGIEALENLRNPIGPTRRHLLPD